MSNQGNDDAVQGSPVQNRAGDDSDLSASGQTFDETMHDAEAEADDRLDR